MEIRKKYGVYWEKNRILAILNLTVWWRWHCYATDQFFSPFFPSFLLPALSSSLLSLLGNAYGRNILQMTVFSKYFWDLIGARTQAFICCLLWLLQQILGWALSASLCSSSILPLHPGQRTFPKCKSHHVTVASQCLRTQCPQWKVGPFH